MSLSAKLSNDFGDIVLKVMPQPHERRLLRRALTTPKNETKSGTPGHIEDKKQGSQKSIRKFRFLPKTKQELIKIRARLDRSKSNNGEDTYGKSSPVMSALIMEDLTETLNGTMVPSVSMTAARKIHQRRLSTVHC